MNRLLATTLEDNLQSIVNKINSLMDTFWIYIVMGLSAVLVIWGIFIGVKIATARRNEEKIDSKEMIKSLVIGIIVIFVIAMGTPLLVDGLAAWVNA